MDGTQFSPSAAYCGTLLQLLGAQVARAQVCLIDAKRGGFASVEDRELEAVLAFGKRTVPGTWAPEELSKNCGNVDVVLLSGDGSVTSEQLQRLIGEVHASLHPEVVACITSFGLSGPKSDWRGSNLVALSAGGSAFYTPGWCQDPELERPLQISEYAADYLAGAVCGVATVGALRDAGGGREITIDVSQQDAVMSMMLLNFAWVTHEGLNPSRIASVGRGTPLVPFHCKDGMFSLLTVQDIQWKNWVEVMGGPAWAHEPIFNTREERSQHWDVLKSLIEEWAADYTKEELFKVGQEAGVPVFPVYTVPEVAAARQLQERGFFKKVRLPGIDDPVEVPFGLFDRVEEVAGVGSKKNAERSVRVVDLSWVLAGPHCTSWLGMMGADVVRIESSHRLDQFRLSPPYWNGKRDTDRGGSFHHINQNKKSMALDLNHPAAKEVILRLVSEADVLVENFGPGQMAKFGLEEATLREANPNLIFISSSGLGRTGPDSQVRAYGNTIHAYAGMTSRIGYAPSDVRGLSGTWADPLTGVVMALIAQSALWRREHDGSGASVDLSMAEVTAFGTILDAFVRFACGTLPADLPENRATAFYINDTFRCAGEDRWVAVSARTRKDAVRAVLAAHGQVNEGMEASQLHAALARAARSRDAEALAQDLQNAGVAAHRVADAVSALADEHPRTRGIVVQVEDFAGDSFPVVALPWRRLESGQIQSPRVFTLPKLGDDTRKVLLEFGFSSAEIEELTSSNALE